MINSLTITETAVAAALERLGNEHQRSAETAENAETHRFFRGWSNAFRKALLYHLQGIRPESTPAGAWLIPSATRGGIVHQVERDGRCSCEASAKHQACWHCAISVGWEVAADDLDRFDGGDEEMAAPEPILVSRVDGGIELTKDGQRAVVSDADPTALRQALQAFGARLCAARRDVEARYQLA